MLSFTFEFLFLNSFFGFHLDHYIRLDFFTVLLLDISVYDQSS